eukprot:Tamp_33248.p2 GENE.Tamp_33248~~Tamp_33248.p2  ORF type:complete len:111 (-),score=11.28 Tamp_33248:234-566(-)
MQAEDEAREREGNDNVRTLGTIQAAVMNIAERCRSTQPLEIRPKREPPSAMEAIKYIDMRINALSYIVREWEAKVTAGTAKPVVAPSIFALSPAPPASSHKSNTFSRGHA